MINLSWLKTFCVLVEVGHFTQTAEKLFMTQSGVSQHIKKLEQQLDTALLIREGKRFSLTEAGKKLSKKGLELLQNTEQLATLIKQDDALIGTVSIASPGSIGLKLYPYLLDLQQTHPTLSINYAFAPNTQIEQNLAQRKIDIGLTTEHSENSTISSQQIASEPLVLVTHHLVTSVNWQTLKTLGFINHPDAAHHAKLLLSKNFAEYEHIQQFNHNGFSNQISLILEPISRGLGFTVLPLHAVNAFHKQSLIKIHALENKVNETLYLCTNRHSVKNQRTQYLTSVIINFLGENTIK
jgi:DNA-binding transcriptional LysR family regulator